MFNTKNFVLEGSDVPSTWVFQYYLDLPERLTGQYGTLSLYLILMRELQAFVYVDKSIMQYSLRISQLVRMEVRLT